MVGVEVTKECPLQPSTTRCEYKRRKHPQNARMYMPKGARSSPVRLVKPQKANAKMCLKSVVLASQFKALNLPSHAFAAHPMQSIHPFGGVPCPRLRNCQGTLVNRSWCHRMRQKRGSKAASSTGKEAIWLQMAMGHKMS